VTPRRDRSQSNDPRLTFKDMVVVQLGKLSMPFLLQ
jgi:hypothetical protein